MRSLKVIDFDRNHLGTITQTSEGQLCLEVLDERHRGDLERFMARISEQKVYLRMGERVEKDGKTTFVTRRKEVRPKDDDFLLGVQALLTKTEFGKTRVRGLLLHREEADDG